MEPVAETRKGQFRLKWLIYPRFQLKLIAVHTLSLVLTLGILWWNLESSFRKIALTGQNAQLSPEHPFFKFVKYEQARIESDIAIAFFVGLIFSSLLSLVISNRLAGPILRMKGFFGRLASGEAKFNPISFRKGDFFTELPDLINGAFARFGVEAEKPSHDQEAEAKRENTEAA